MLYDQLIPNNFLANTVVWQQIAGLLLFSNFYIFAFWNFPHFNFYFSVCFSCNILWQVHDVRVKYSTTVICFFFFLSSPTISVKNSKLEPSTSTTLHKLQKHFEMLSCRSMQYFFYCCYFFIFIVKGAAKRVQSGRLPTQKHPHPLPPTVDEQYNLLSATLLRSAVPLCSSGSTETVESRPPVSGLLGRASKHYKLWCNSLVGAELSARAGTAAPETTASGKVR